MRVLIAEIEWTEIVGLVKRVSVCEPHEDEDEGRGFGVSMSLFPWVRGKPRTQLEFDHVEQRARLRVPCPGTEQAALVMGPLLR